jgi:DNA-binding NarL/FixJ family response regulator
MPAPGRNCFSGLVRGGLVQVRVFLVEDLAPLRSLVQDLLGFLGGLQVVGTAATEAEAIAWLDQHSGEWDLAVVDLALAEGTGRQVIRRAWQARLDAGVAVFSSFLSPAVERHCTQLGADAVFEKNYTGPFIAWLNHRLHGPRLASREPGHAGQKRNCGCSDSRGRSP